MSLAHDKLLNYSFSAHAWKWTVNFLNPNSQAELSASHFSYLMVIGYFTGIMCLGLQMKSTGNHSLSCGQIQFLTLLLLGTLLVLLKLKLNCIKDYFKQNNLLLRIYSCNL